MSPQLSDWLALKPVAHNNFGCFFFCRIQIEFGLILWSLDKKCNLNLISTDASRPGRSHWILSWRLQCDKVQWGGGARQHRRQQPVDSPAKINRLLRYLTALLFGGADDGSIFLMLFFFSVLESSVTRHTDTYVVTTATHADRLMMSGLKKILKNLIIYK